MELWIELIINAKPSSRTTDVYIPIDRSTVCSAQKCRSFTSIQCHSGIPKLTIEKSIGKSISIIIWLPKPTNDLWTKWNVSMHDGTECVKKCQNRSGTPMRTDWWRIILNIIVKKKTFHSINLRLFSKSCRTESKEKQKLKTWICSNKCCVQAHFPALSVCVVRVHSDCDYDWKCVCDSAFCFYFSVSSWNHPMHSKLDQ